MKFSLVLFAFFYLFYLPGIFPQEKDIREDVVVINVEVPVRVMYKGKPVDNLKRSDFRLFENGQELPVNGFNIVRKKISSQKIELESGRTQFYKPRFFVLVFNIVQYNNHLVKGLNFLFDNVLKDSDKLLVLANSQLLVFEDVQEKQEVREKIKYVLKRQGLIATAELDRYINKINQDLARSKYTNRIDAPHYDVYDYLSNYLHTWKEFKTRFLTPDINKYYEFARFLEKIKLEKWVISFYQFEKFPQLTTQKISNMVNPVIARLRTDKGGESVAFVQMLEKLLLELTLSLKSELLFPTDEVSKLFYKVNATFHTLFIPTITDSMSGAMSMSNIGIATALENNLREITKKTGGTLLTTSNLEIGLKEIIDVEDILYLITYAPDDNSKPGRLKIKVAEKKYQVLYDDNIRADYITRFLDKRKSGDKTVEIQDVKFVDKKLFFDLKSYAMTGSEDDNSGNINVQVTIKDINNKILYSKNSNIFPKKATTNLTVDFKWLVPGRYDLMLDIIDNLKGKGVFEYKKIQVK